MYDNLDEFRDYLITDYSTLKQNHPYLLVIYEDQWQVPVKLVDGRDMSHEASPDQILTFDHIRGDDIRNFRIEPPDIPHMFNQFPLEIYIGDLYNPEYHDDDYFYRIRIYDLEKIAKKIRETIYEETPLKEDVINEVIDYIIPTQHYGLPPVPTLTATKKIKTKRHKKIVPRGGRRTNKRLHKSNSNKHRRNRNTKRRNIQHI